VLAKLGWAELVVSYRGEEVGGAAADFYDLGSKKKKGPKGVEGREKKEKVFFFLILKSVKQMISNVNLNSNTSKQCISMYVTLNS
jgi:hypothetical protein